MKTKLKKPPARPVECNICGGQVNKVNNKVVYGKTFGNGIMYLCDNCGARVGAHNNGNALGLLADDFLRAKKVTAHDLFDPLWESGRMSRSQAYRWLSKKMNLPNHLTHFGYFNHDLLDKAITLIKEHRGIVNGEPVGRGGINKINK